MKRITIRAVIVGVSEYKNFPEEQQLLYADDDAKTLYDFLRTKAEIDSSNIHVFLNAEAHGASIKAHLYRILFKESQPGDVVIFYFAGHGDVDATIDDGFLLMHDVSADGDYFISDALQVSDVQGLITTAGSKGVKVILITDACRAGKLVGDSRGALHTTAALLREWNYALKLVSCQSDQSSMEGERWGDGHGVFTFHLVNGLMGLADENKDKVVSFGEISDYVRAHVKKDTEYRQVPKSTGDETYNMFLVEDSALAEAEAVMKAHREKFNYPTINRGIRTRGGVISDKIRSAITQLRTEIKNENLRGSMYFVNDDESMIQIDKVKTSIAHSRQINDICYISDQDILVTASADNLLKTFQGASLKELNTLAKHKAPVLCVASNPTNTDIIVSGGMDNTLYLWSANSGKTLGKMKGAHATKVNDVIFTRDGEHIISAGDDNNINIWSTMSAKLSSTLSGHKSNVIELCISPDGRILISGGENGEILVWDLSSKTMHQIEHHTKPITTILFPKDNRSFITASKGESIAIWNLDKLELIKGIKLTSPKEELLNCHNQNLFVRDRRGAIYFLNTNSEKATSSTVRTKGVSVVHFSEENERIYWVTGIGNIAGADLALPKLKPSVLHLFGELLKMGISEQLKEILKAEVFSALISSAEGIIEPFIRGLTRLPSIQQIQESITDIEEALKIYPDDSLLTRKASFQKLFLEVQEILLSNDYQEYPLAIEKLDLIIKEEPNAAYTYNTKSVIYQKLQEVDKAKKNASIAKEKTPSWSEPRNNLGKIYLEEGEYEKAITEYKEIISIHPKSSKGYSNVGSIYASLGDFKRAEGYYKQSIAADSLNPDIYLKYSQLQLRRGRYKDAERLLKKSNDIDSLDVSSLLQSGMLYDFLFRNDFNSAERFEEAHRLLIKANTQYPNDSRTYTDLSKFYINNFENQSVNAMSFLYTYFEVKEQDKSELTLAIANHVKLLCEVALRLNPYSDDALDGVAFSTLILNKNAEAERLYIASIAKNPNTPRVYCRYAKYCSGQDMIEKAVSNYNKAIELDPKYLLAYAELWGLLRQQKDMVGIKKLYALATKNFPNSPIFDYKRSVLPGYKPSKKEIENILKKDNNFYYASLLAYNYNYTNLAGQPSVIEDEQYVTRVRRTKRISSEYTIIQDKDMFDEPIYGLMHASGAISIAIEYDTIVKVNATTVLAARSPFSSTGSAMSGLYWFNMSGDLKKLIKKYGTLNNNGNPGSKNNTYITMKHGCYDLNGNILIPEKFDYIHHFSNGNKLILVEKDGKFGCYNLYGQYVIPAKYDMILPASTLFQTPGVSCKLGGNSISLNYAGKPLK